jgi:hypothetical protein
MIEWPQISGWTCAMSERGWKKDLKILSKPLIFYTTSSIDKADRSTKGKSLCWLEAMASL